MQYNYTKTPIDYDRLSQEIRQSSIVTALDYISGTTGNTSIYFKALLSVQDQATLDSIVAAHTGEPLIETVVQEVVFSSTDKNEYGNLKVAAAPETGDAASIVSHDFSDPCSWFQSSLPMVKETLIIHSGEGIPANTFKSSSNKINWIDLFHGRVYDEDNVVLQNPGKYDVKIYINDVIQLTNTYSVDYPSGIITLNSPLPEGATITASYYYSDKSYYSIRPKPGKVLAISRTEVQFSTGTELLAPFVFEAWFHHPIVGPVPVPGTRNVYKNAKDFISACNLGQGTIPAWGELTKDVQVFPFDYVRPKPLKYSQGVEIRVYCKDHLPVNNCEFATATFYVTIDNE